MRSNRAHIILRESYYKVFGKSSACICPPDCFIVRIVERKTVNKERKVVVSSLHVLPASMIVEKKIQKFCL